MDFGSLLSVAQKNAKTNKVSSERNKFYSAKFEPPKKESKDKKLSDGIRKFLQQKEMEEAREKERKKREYEELMATRTERDKNKIRKHLKVTKSANKSVLDDAINKTDTAVTMQGPEQPDEDDYGYTSNEASALYKSLMDKYKSIPEDKKFSKSSLSGSKNADLMSTKDRVRAAILREREEEKLGRKRTHTTSLSGDGGESGSSNSLSALDQKHRSRKNLYDPKAEREAEERRREEERRQKMKAKRPPPPVMDFQKLLKLAEEKQHQPIQVELPQKPKEPERLLTSKEKKELEERKREMEERERRKNGLPPIGKSQTNNGDQRKADPPATAMPNGRIPKLNSTNAAPPSVPSKSAPNKVPPKLPSTNDSNRKPSSTQFKVPIRPVSSISSSKLSTKPQSQPQSHSNGPKYSNGAMKSTNSATTSSAMHGKQRPPIDAKTTKSQSHDMQRNVSKQQQQSKPADSRNIKPREFPPRDVVKSREFPPRDLIKSREFPPRDVQRSGHGHSSMKQKPSAAMKRRILDDSDEDEYDSEMDDFIDDGDEELDYSSEIRKMFGYDKSRYRDDDDDVDNMESSFAQQQREEFISKKCGLMEDLEDMRLEAEEKKRKAASAKRRRH